MLTINLRQTEPRGASARAAALLLLVLSFAHASANPPARQRAGQPPRAAAQSRPAAAPARERAVPQETLLRIVRAEDERRWDASDLGVLLADASASVRRRAAIAAGRIGDEGAVAPLASLLSKDMSEGVRAAAAFALGEIESGAGADALVQALRASKSAEVRARAVEALGKVAAALPRAEEVRQRELGEVILSTLNIEQRSPKPARGVVLLGLTAALRARPADAGKTVAQFLSSTDARVRADAANTLARLRAKDASEQLRQLLANDPEPIVRANAARALGAAEDAASAEALTLRSTNDADERVRVSALRALAALRHAPAAAPLLIRGEGVLANFKAAKAKSAAGVPSEAGELLELATTLGRVLADTNDERALNFLRALRDALEMGAPEVEVALARLAPAQYLRERPFASITRGQRLDASLRWQSIASLAQGLGELASISSATAGNSAVMLQADAQMLLRALLSDANTPALAQPDILRAVAAFKPPDQAELMRARLAASADPIVRATAADLLGEVTPPDPANVDVLAQALPRALKEETNDAALSILEALSKQRTAEAALAVKSALEVPDYVVRRRAAALLREMSGGAGEARAETAATRNKPPDYLRALARAGRSVRAVVTTDKGAFTIELLPEAAPLTVDNFVQLANRKYFDGVAFHRVVPNFVVQGGDPRGDGNGGPGYQIRCEINEVPYARGAVGMALSGKDTGGSQWFVTHSPQPHLDGGYTVFGRVVEGMGVVDRLSRGDRIRSVSVTEKALSRK